MVFGSLLNFVLHVVLVIMLRAVRVHFHPDWAQRFLTSSSCDCACICTRMIDHVPHWACQILTICLRGVSGSMFLHYPRIKHYMPKNPSVSRSPNSCVKHFSSFIPQHFSEIVKMASPFFWNQENAPPTTLPGLRPVTVTHEVKELALFLLQRVWPRKMARCDTQIQNLSANSKF